jgi:flagellar protein FlaG
MEDRVTRQSAPDSGVESATQVKRGSDSDTQRELLEQMVGEINREYQSRSIALKFSIDDKSDSLIIQVMDTTNDKIIRQIPPDEILAIRRRMRALLGDIFDAEA